MGWPGHDGLGVRRPRRMKMVEVGGKSHGNKGSGEVRT